MIYLKAMSKLKKFLIVFLSFLPFSAGMAMPLVVGTIAGVGIIAGFSIYRTAAPVNMADALNFFSTCWSCQMFSDIMATMSGLVPRVYDALGTVIIPFAIALIAIWAAWKILSGFINVKMDETWSLVSEFGTKFIKLSVITLLLLIPFVNVIYTCILIPYKFAKCFGQSTLFSVLNIFFPYVCYLIMAFGSAQYIGPYTKAPQPITQ